MSQEWILAEEAAGRSVDMNRVNERLRVLTNQQNTVPRSEFNELSSEQMHYIIYNPFGEKCAVDINTLSQERYEKIPLVRQTLFLLNKINESELKLTKLGWLPLKVVAEAYSLGQPEYIIEELGQKRINEYEAKSVEMARAILEILGWTKIRKGMLSLTLKGKKALSNIDDVANKILRISLTAGILHTFDGYEDDRIGNFGIAYSAWLLDKFGSTWQTGDFYQSHYQKVFDFPDKYNAYATRVFKRLFYWLGIVEYRINRNTLPPFREEYRKTELFPMIFSIKQ